MVAMSCAGILSREERERRGWDSVISQSEEGNEKLWRLWSGRGGLKYGRVGGRRERREELSPDLCARAAQVDRRVDCECHWPRLGNPNTPRPSPDCTRSPPPPIAPRHHLPPPNLSHPPPATLGPHAYLHPALPIGQRPYRTPARPLRAKPLALPHPVRTTSSSCPPRVPADPGGSCPRCNSTVLSLRHKNVC